MIRKGITLPTHVDRVAAPDLYAPSGAQSLAIADMQRSSDPRARLSAVSYIAARRRPMDDLGALADLCRQRVEPVLYGRGLKVLLFVADGPWQPKSALMKRKQLWSMRPWALGKFLFPSLSDAIAVEREAGIRCAGLATVSRRGFELAVQVARKESSNAILARASDAVTSDDVAALFSAAFPVAKGAEVTSVDWTSLSRFACSRGDILVRVSGGFDDPSAAIDLIFDPARHPIEAL